jgi:L-alanine-DL-glutamate epimerase-like enolase superfamily enzyme
MDRSRGQPLSPLRLSPHHGAGIEYVDHLHEHFEDPCLVENGAYQLPTTPGFSIQMKPATFEEFGFSADSSGNAES